MVRSEGGEFFSKSTTCREAPKNKVLFRATGTFRTPPRGTSEKTKKQVGHDAVLEHDAAPRARVRPLTQGKALGPPANSRAIDEAGSRRGRSVGAIGATAWRRASQQAGVADQ